MKQNPDRPNSKHGPWGRKRGFILIVTVTLLGFLVLLLVFLSLIVRVETAVATNSVRTTQARQNALFALRVAIGQLQKEAGPDQRVTATADLVNPSAENSRWTGVWDSRNLSKPAIWLVSHGDPSSNPDPTTALADLVNPVRLVGSGTAFTAFANQVDVELASIEVDSYPGLEGSQVIGRYAYWVGDEGVKASLVLPDLIDEVDYGQFSFRENRYRLRQQVPIGPQRFKNFRDESQTDYNRADDPDPDIGFDPCLGVNRDAIPGLITRNQVRILEPTFRRTNFARYLESEYHDFTPSAFGVLASTHPGIPGLKKDLSRKPDLLGTGFAKWADYAGESAFGSRYMENPGSATAVLVSPPISSESDLRRRYFIVAPPPPNSVVDGQLVHSISPVVTCFFIQFGVRKNSNELVVGSRVFTSLWNPYTSALVPEELFLEIEGLPTIGVSVIGGSDPPVSIDLQDSSFSPVRLTLPFLGSSQEEESWLPGRTYNWRSAESSLTSLEFNVSELGTIAGFSAETNLELSDTGNLEISGVDGSIQLRLIHRVSGTDEVLSEIQIPEMAIAEGTVIETAGDSSETWDFGFGFRLLQPSTDDAVPCEWLSTDGVDPRARILSPSLIVPFNPNLTLTDGWDPSEYDGVVATVYDSSPGLILNRPDKGEGNQYYQSFFHDTPLFELPRGPVLSLGSLQHMQVEGFHPFSIGSSALMVESDEFGRSFGSWWDRFFFSGETFEDDRGNSSRIEPLPYYHLKSVDTRSDQSSPLTLGDLRVEGEFTSRYLLLRGAFNINSTSVNAWSSVLRSLRPSVITDETKDPPELSDWQYVNLYGLEGGQYAEDPVKSENFEDDTQALDDLFVPEVSRRGSAFLRYSHSASETFDVVSLTSAKTSPSGHDRRAYRQGVWGGHSGTGTPADGYFSSLDIEALSERIVALVRTFGPFESLESFLSPKVGTPPAESILDRAVELAGLNSGVPDGTPYEFSQREILTAVGPMLATRSDTFVIRAYGEVLNPIRDRDDDGFGDVEARAWCEAIVQRLPAYVDPTIDDPEDLPTVGSVNETFGRRFEVVHFRWLTAEDI